MKLRGWREERAEGKAEKGRKPRILKFSGYIYFFEGMASLGVRIGTQIKRMQATRICADTLFVKSAFPFYF